MASRPTVSPDRCRDFHATIVGNDELKGKLLGSGPILELIDLATCAACFTVAPVQLVTVAIDAFQMFRPVFHGDFVRLEARVIQVNTSSIVAQTSVYRQDFASGEFELTHNCIATFVGFGEDGKKHAGLPKLADPSRPEECAALERLASRRRELIARVQAAENEVSSLSHITSGMIPRLESDMKQVVNVRDTVIEIRRAFSMKYANSGNNVFGGVILEWMERAALLCARNLTKNEAMATVSLTRAHFKLPIRIDDMMSIRARVCRVKKNSVEVELIIVRIFTDEQISHTGFAEVANLSSLTTPRQPKAVDIQVTAEESDQESMRAILKAQRREEFDQEEAASLDMPPVPLSITKEFVPVSFQ